MTENDRTVRLGNRLRELREAKGMTRAELGEAAGLSERAIIKWERGEREPGWFNITALAEALGVSCEAFAEPAARKPTGSGRSKKDAGPADKKALEPLPEAKPKRRKN